MNAKCVFSDKLLSTTDLKKEDVRRRSLILFLPLSSEPEQGQQDPAFRKRIQSLLGPDCADLTPVSVGGQSPSAADAGTSNYSRSASTKFINLPRQGLFLDTWLGTHTSTMSREVTDIHGDRADFASGKEVQCNFL